MALFWLAGVRVTLLFQRVHSASFRELSIQMTSTCVLRLTGTECDVGPVCGADNTLSRWRACGPAHVTALAIVLNYRIVVVLHIRVVRIQLVQPLMVPGGLDFPLLRLAALALALSVHMDLGTIEWISVVSGRQCRTCLIWPQPQFIALVLQRPVPFAQIELVLVLSCPCTSIMNDHVGGQTPDVRVIRQLRDLRGVDPIFVVDER